MERQAYNEENCGLKNVLAWPRGRYPGPPFASLIPKVSNDCNGVVSFRLLGQNKSNAANTALVVDVGGVAELKHPPDRPLGPIPYALPAAGVGMMSAQYFATAGLTMLGLNVS